MVGFNPSALGGAPLPVWGLGTAEVSGDGAFTLVGDPLPLDLYNLDNSFGTLTSAAIDLDGDSIDELMLVNSGSFPDSQVRIFLPTLDESFGWTAPPPLIIPDASYIGQRVITGDPRSAWFHAGSSRPQVCQLDGEQAPTVVLGVVERRVCQGDALVEEPRTVLYALSAELLGAARRGEPVGIPLEARIEPPPGEAIVGFACLNGDQDRADELALLLLRGPMSTCEALAPEDEVPLTARVAFVRWSGGPGANPSTFVELSGLEVESLSVASLGTAPLSGMASGDVDGDGVEDLVVGAASSTILLKGRPLTP
jgi:hypothetical protein